MIVLVTGASGQVGRSLQKVAGDYPETAFHFYDRARLDITDQAAVLQLADDLCPDYIINCAAYTAVDKAESEPERAELINSTAVAYLAKAALEVGATLVHYSSDYVYHNGVKELLSETDPTDPQGVYARTKLQGEQQIANLGCKAIVVRTSWVYSEYGHNFVKTMLRLGRERDQLSIVDDQIGCPTYATDIAHATMQMIAGYPTIADHQVTINYAGAGQLSWYDFAVEIFSQSGIAIELAPIPSSDYPTPAPRPGWSVMDMRLLFDIFGIYPRPWQESLADCIALLGPDD